MKFVLTLWVFLVIIFVGVGALPPSLLYDIQDNAQFLPKQDDVSSREIRLRTPIVFFGIPFESIYVNSNGFLSFQTEIPQFINIEFPLDYPIIAPFYSNVDTTSAGDISYYETHSSSLLRRASQNVHDTFSNQEDFQATSLFIATWSGVGYYNQKSDKINTYQVVISTDGASTFVEFLYPENGIQWIQGTGDESGLPDARAQAGIISPEGKLFTLPGSGTEQVRNLEKWTNMNLKGQFIYKVDGPVVEIPDLNNDNLPSPDRPITCDKAALTSCHVQAKCIDYDTGFCCECKPKFYGNGRFCVKNDVPLRVNGKINGKINEEKLENLDLQSYIVMSDGRAYTAISKIPEPIGHDIQSMQILGGVIGYLFAKPIRGALNGYQITGGVFNHTATITFHNSSHVIRIRQKYHGLDVFDQLRLEIDIQGDIPEIPEDTEVIIDQYEEQYTETSPGVIQSSSSRIFKYENVEIHYTVDQTFLFDYCKFKNDSAGVTWKLKVGKNFISYEEREQIIRFGLNNKITPLGDIDPCDEGRSKCGENSACVVENDSYRCVCNPGYQNVFNGNETLCADQDECQSGLHDCDYNAICINVIGSYTCQCKPGFEGNGQLCEEARSCDSVRCNDNAHCEAVNNIARCKCLPGFTGDGQICDPIIDQSCHVSNNCSPYGLCNINPETNLYSCVCLPGYTGDGYRCEALPSEEVTEEGTKNVIQRCLLGVCWCPTGYMIQPNSKYCILPDSTPIPINETNGKDELSAPEVQCFNSTICFCPKSFTYDQNRNNCIIESGIKLQTKGLSRIHMPSCNVQNNCNKDAQCLLLESTGNYSCVCNEGFVGDGLNCIQEPQTCDIAKNCHPHASCIYDSQSAKFKCLCNIGYDGTGYTCTFFSSFCNSNSDCSTTEECNTAKSGIGRNVCQCKENHIRDSQDHCIPENLNCGGGICAENAVCLFDDTEQIPYCSCKTGYIGDGISECILKPVGCDTLNNCDLNARCIYNNENYSYACKCNDGFFGDGQICHKERNCNNDPTMCDSNARCALNYERQFVCQCNQDFVGNGRICRPKVQLEGNFLLVNQGMVTLKVPMEPTKTNQGKPLQIRANQVAVGLDIDCSVGKMYWSDTTGRAIRSASFNGTNKSDFIADGIGSPEGLAVDWVSRNIYWTDSAIDTIEVANLDTKLRKKLFSTDLVNPRGIAVHPQRGKIFWTDWNRKQPKIEWANADGTGREIFLTGESVSLPNSLAIDYDEDRLYYADAGTKKIESIQLDTRQRQTIATNCTYPFGIAVTDNLVYWTDWISKKIERANKFTFERLPPLPVRLGFGNKIFQLIAVPNKCPPLTNVCQYHKCKDDHICLPNGAGSRTCTCAYKSYAPEDLSACE